MRIRYLYDKLSGRRTRISIGILILCLAFISSGYSANTRDLSNQIDYPLALNSKWTYHTRHELGEGVHFSGSLGKLANGNVLDATVTSEVTGMDVIHGTKYFRVESRVGGNPWLTEWYRLGPEGLLLGKTVDHEAGEETLMVPPQKILSARLRPGESWSWRASKAPVRIQTKVVGPAVVNVPAGDFGATQVFHDMAIEVEGNQINVQQNRWFVAGVGYVKQETMSFVGKRLISHVVLTLEKFEPGSN